MSILANVPSILLFALDIVNEESDTTADTNPIAKANTGGTETQKETIERNSFLDRILQTDSLKKQIRIAIPIDDRILPAHHVGNSSNLNKFVDYDESAVAIVPGSNGVTIQLEIKNSISGISTAADIFTALAGKQKKLFTSTPRVSFFGSNIAIFNAYLTGLTRQTVKGTDKELVNISLEYADPETSVEKQPIEQQLNNGALPVPIPGV